jgi:hypothetical protein
MGLSALSLPVSIALGTFCFGFLPLFLPNDAIIADWAVFWVAYWLNCMPLDVRLTIIRLLPIIIGPVPYCPSLLGRVPGAEPLLSTLVGSSVKDSYGVPYELMVAYESVGEGWLILYSASTG